MFLSTVILLPFLTSLPCFDYVQGLMSFCRGDSGSTVRFKLVSSFVFVEVLQYRKHGAHWTTDDEDWFCLNNQLNKFNKLISCLQIHTQNLH